MTHRSGDSAVPLAADQSGDWAVVAAADRWADSAVEDLVSDLS
jgi:hypothetical protein